MLLIWVDIDIAMVAMVMEIIPGKVEADIDPWQRCSNMARIVDRSQREYIPRSGWLLRTGMIGICGNKLGRGLYLDILSRDPVNR
jgi:hypothetical protein